MNTGSYLRPVGSPLNHTIYHSAVNYGAINCLKFLLTKNRLTNHLNEPDSDGSTALHLVIKSIHGKRNKIISDDDDKTNTTLLLIAKYLVTEGADVSSRDNDGDTVIHKLVKVENTTIATANTIIELLALFLEQNVHLEARNKLQLSATDILDRRLLADDTNVASEMKKMIDQKMNASNCSQSVEGSISSVVVDILQEQTVEKIIDSLDDINSKQTHSNIGSQFLGWQTILHNAADVFDHRVVRCLLSLGYDPWVLNTNCKELPLHASLSRGDFKTTKLLLQAMKQRKFNNILELSDLSFSLFQRLLCNFREHDEEHLDINYMKCLEEILQEGNVIDISQVNHNQINAFDLMDWFDLDDVRKKLQKYTSNSNREYSSKGLCQCNAFYMEYI